MVKLACPVCLNEMDLPDEIKEGDTLQCPYCYAEFMLVKQKGEWAASL